MEKESENSSISSHKRIVDKIHELYKIKNAQYGNSFHELYEELGLISGVTQIAHKYHRLIQLVKGRKPFSVNETDTPIIDTLYDLANYCILLIMELEQDADEESEPIWDDTKKESKKDTGSRFGDKEYNVLSQEEVDSLLSALSSGEFDDYVGSEEY